MCRWPGRNGRRRHSRRGGPSWVRVPPASLCTPVTCGNVSPLTGGHIPVNWTASVQAVSRHPRSPGSTSESLCPAGVPNSTPRRSHSPPTTPPSRRSARTQRPLPKRSVERRLQLALDKGEAAGELRLQRLLQRHSAGCGFNGQRLNRVQAHCLRWCRIRPLSGGSHLLGADTQNINGRRRAPGVEPPFSTGARPTAWRLLTPAWKPAARCRIRRHHTMIKSSATITSRWYRASARTG